MENLPRLRPRQWALLQRLVAIEKRLESQQVSEPIAVAFTNGGTVIARPGVADAEIDDGDLAAIRALGALDEVSWNTNLARFRVSHVGFDLAREQLRASGEPTTDQLLATYRERRRWLAGRVSDAARWAVLIAGVAVIVWGAWTESWVFVVVGVFGAIFGTPVTGVAAWVHTRLTAWIDRWLLGVFEPTHDSPRKANED